LQTDFRKTLCCRGRPIPAWPITGAQSGWTMEYVDRTD
jgi:hypothetical protein